MTFHFTDGTEISSDFTEQKTNDAARAIMLEAMQKSPYLILVTEGTFLMYPVVNIKAIQLVVPAGRAETPPSKVVIRGATIVE